MSKGISIAIETIIYLILGITVLSVLLFFFLTQAGPAQDQFRLEADRNRYCGSYVSKDLLCKGSNSGPVKIGAEVLEGIGKACGELNMRFNFNYKGCDSPGSPAGLECIKNCCLTCPKP